MNIIVRGKNIQVTPALKDHVERRIGKLDKFLQIDDTQIQVALSVEKDRHRVEVTIPLNGYILRGEEETGDMYASIDMVLDKLEKQAAKYKTKISRKNKNGSIKDLALGDISSNNDEFPKVVRTKRFAMKPMSVDEAIMQMNLVGHNFFVFTNDETSQVNVVYKRKDSDYGLIEPD